MSRSTMLVCFAAMLVSCGGDDAAAPEGEGPTATESGGESTPPTPAAQTPEQSCMAVMTRERECQAEFIPAVVALRVRLDNPSGIAAQDASGGRDALVAEARREYTADSTDEVFRRNCAQMSSLPAEQASSWNEMMQGCLAAADCAAFVECDMRFTEARFSAR